MINFKSKSEFSKNILTLLTGTTIAQLIPIAISPILTRIYSPEDFGMLALFISIVGILSVAVTAKYDFAIILPKLHKNAYLLLILSIMITLLVSIIYFIAVVALSYFFTFDWIYFLVPLVVVLIGLYNILDKYNNRTKNYKSMSLQRVIKTTLDSGVSIVLGVLFSIKTGLIFGFFTGYLVSGLSMSLMHYQLFKTQKLKISFFKLYALAKKYINFPKYTMPHTLLNTFSTNAPIFLIPIYYGNITLGLYAFGLKIIQAPLSLLSSSVFNVLGQKMANMHSNERSLENIFLNTLRKLGMIAVLLIPVLIFIDDIFSFVFGSEWQVAGEYIQLLSPWILMVFIVSPFSSIPHIFHKQKKALYLEIVYSLVRVLPFVVGAGALQLELKTVLYIYMLSGTLLLLYGLYWYYSLIKEPVNISLQ